MTFWAVLSTNWARSSGKSVSPGLTTRSHIRLVVCQSLVFVCIKYSTTDLCSYRITNHSDHFKRVQPHRRVSLVSRLSSLYDPLCTTPDVTCCVTFPVVSNSDTETDHSNTGRLVCAFSSRLLNPRRSTVLSTVSDSWRKTAMQSESVCDRSETHHHDLMRPISNTPFSQHRQYRNSALLWPHCTELYN